MNKFTEKFLKNNYDEKFVGTNRIVYKLDNFVYKVYINPAGAASNKNELELHGKSFLFPNVIRINKKIIRMEYQTQIKFDKKKELRNDILVYVETLFFHSETQKKRITPNLSRKHLKIKESCSEFIPNHIVTEIVRVCIEYSIEPADLIYGLVNTEKGIKALDFGLTTKAYFDNMFLIVCGESQLCCMKNLNGIYKFTKNSKPLARKLKINILDAVKKYKKIKPQNNKIYIP